MYCMQSERVIVRDKGEHEQVPDAMKILLIALLILPGVVGSARKVTRLITGEEDSEMRDRLNDPKVWSIEAMHGPSAEWDLSPRMAEVAQSGRRAGTGARVSNDDRYD